MSLPATVRASLASTVAVVLVILAVVAGAWVVRLAGWVPDAGVPEPGPEALMAGGP